jgi:hypothetical protein
MAEVVLVLRRQVGGGQDVEVGNQHARRVASHLVAILHPAPAEVGVALSHTQPIGQLGENVLALRAANDVGVGETIIRSCLGVNPSPDNDGVVLLLHPPADPRRQLVVRGPDTEPHHVGLNPTHQVDDHVFFLRRRHLVGEVVFEEDRMDFVPALFQERMKDA